MIGGSCAGVEGGVSSRKVEDTEEGGSSKGVWGDCWIREVMGEGFEGSGLAGGEGPCECEGWTMGVWVTGEEGEGGC